VQDDIFCCVNRDYQDQRSKLITILKPQVLSFLNDIYMKSENFSLSSFDAEKLREFFELEASKMNGLSEEAMDLLLNEADPSTFSGVTRLIQFEKDGF
jgi:hypothetical protein